MRAESLQWRPSRWLEAFIATRSVTGVAKKSLRDAACDDPRAPLSLVTVYVQLIATVRAGGRFVAVVSSVRPPNAATAAGFSIATTAALSPGIPCCSSALSDVPAEIAFHILSANTPAFAAVAIVEVAPCLGVAFSVELTDLDWGSWEGSLPEGSSLGGDRTPLRGALIGLHTGFKNSLPGKLYQLCAPGDTSPPSTRGGLAPSGPPKCPILSPPPTLFRGNQEFPHAIYEKSCILSHSTQKAKKKRRLWHFPREIS